MTAAYAELTWLEEGNYTSVEEYAKECGVSRATVKRRCQDGTLRAKKVGRAWLIPMGWDKEEETT